MSSINTRNKGYIRVAACAPHVSVGDVKFNVNSILDRLADLEERNVPSHC